MRLRYLLQLLACIAGMLSNTTVGATTNCLAPLKHPELLMCESAQLQQLERSLDAAYKGAFRVTKNQNRLKTQHAIWLTSERNNCLDETCLIQAYRQRISRLKTEQIKLSKVLGEPLTDVQAREVCTSLASTADRGELASYAVPATPVSSPIKIERLPEDVLGLFAEPPSQVFELNLGNTGSLTKFANYFTGGTCASISVVNLDRLQRREFNSTEKEEVDDTEDMIRWAYWGGGDYPILYRGRYFMVTTDLRDDNDLNLVSWIKPNGKVRPLCLFEAKPGKRTVRRTQNPALCAAVASDDLQPLSPEMLLPPNSAKPEDAPNTTAFQLAEFHKNFGRDVDGVHVHKVDVEGDGQQLTIGAFGFESGAGCGSSRRWLRNLTSDGTAIQEAPIDQRFKKLSRVINLFTWNKMFYVHAEKTPNSDGLFSLSGTGINQVCEFSVPRTTKIKIYFSLK